MPVLHYLPQLYNISWKLYTWVFSCEIKPSTPPKKNCIQMFIVTLFIIAKAGSKLVRYLSHWVFLSKHGDLSHSFRTHRRRKWKDTVVLVIPVLRGQRLLASRASHGQHPSIVGELRKQGNKVGWLLPGWRQAGGMQWQSTEECKDSGLLSTHCCEITMLCFFFF